MVQSFSTMTADYTISSRQRSGGSGTVRIRNSGEGVATIEGSEGGHDDGQRRLSFLDGVCPHTGRGADDERLNQFAEAMVVSGVASVTAINLGDCKLGRASSHPTRFRKEVLPGVEPHFSLHLR